MAHKYLKESRKTRDALMLELVNCLIRFTMKLGAHKQGDSRGSGTDSRLWSCVVDDKEEQQAGFILADRRNCGPPSDLT